ncbi:MAG: hypothetical protein D6698_16965 [Gammaproteobacteria bacterium]|nr:MAG: hypothetical protein D6698_16965 [Gammaproteobacteria bacterium]
MRLTAHRLAELLKRKDWMESGRGMRFGLAGILGVLLTAAWFWSPEPKDVRAANVFARSFSVGWVTDKPGDACVVAFADLSLSSLRDFDVVCAGDKSLSQLVNFTDMKPETTYNLLVVDGIRFRLKALPRVTTLAIDEENPLPPNPAYGMVYDVNKKRAGGALVYVYTVTGRPQYPIGVLANEQGNYALDLSNLMIDGNSYVLVARKGADQSAKIETDVRRTTPLPPIWLERGGLE